MPKMSHVKLLKQVKVDGKWILAEVLFDTKNRVRRDHVLVAGNDEIHPEGSYFIQWCQNAHRYREAVGADPQDAADKGRVKQAEIAAARARTRATTYSIGGSTRRLSALRAGSSILADLPHLPPHSQFLQDFLSEAPCRRG